MSLLMDLVYAVAGVVAAPWLVRKSVRTGKYQRGLGARFGVGDEVLPSAAERTGGKVLLLHCVSVGELNSVQTLIGQLLAADAALRIVVSTTTDTGWERAVKLYGGDGGAQGAARIGKMPMLRDAVGGTPLPRRVYPVRFPFDFSFAMERLFDRVMPDAVALVELETWPNFLEIAQDRRVPVALINGRISERSFPRYRLIRPVMAGMLRKIAWIGAQTETIAKRFRRLGGRDVEVIPTLKYDNAQIADRVAGQQALAAAMGLAAEHRLFVGGSTGPGEEEALLDAYMELRGKYPELRLAIVPRHPEVVGQVVRAIEKRGLVPVLRTERPDGSETKPESRKPKLESSQVFILNTMGELRKLYALAFGVFVGRSLVKLGGSDMIEVAALGKPCCFGPYTANFAEVVELLTTGGGAEIVKNGAALKQALEQWLANPSAAAAMGLRAQELVRQQQGSTQRYVKRLLAILHSHDRVSELGN